MRLIVISIVSVVLLGALIFIPAGRLDYTPGWICLIVLVIGFSAIAAHVAKHTPSLIQRRMKVGAGTPAWDRVFVYILEFLFVSILVVGGLDAGRYHWTSLPLWLQAAGLILMIAGMLVLGWAMGQNPHFESTVRIQADQKHRVIKSGPYRIVRHPGYVAAILLMIGMALVLDSAWALLPAFLAVVDLVARTGAEDRFLQNNLEGYRDFAKRTRYRLVPGIW
ncbi:MAG TPA: isoprenylcysteine carboxylmethyltransferase family protein [Terriglobia bacterium]|nr:isoprenylcysteine carboxylmethyltransferase family protein [Terriglobia bacterium]